MGSDRYTNSCSAPAQRSLPDTIAERNDCCVSSSSAKHIRSVVLGDTKLSAKMRRNGCLRNALSLKISAIQAQRDFFGAHGFERIDGPGAFHGPWGSGAAG
ncbi:hypothetical protein [Mesorhizobium sp. M0435]|uniref:hypothetical protein n=1 Tax=unclassified Mesorhizobium TaxID=325217 RepID=UPI003335FD39